MPRRKVKPKFDKKLIIEAFTEMAREKGIDRDLLQGLLEETLSLMVKKKYGNDASFDIIVNMDKGDIEIYLTREVVRYVLNESKEISVQEVKLHTDDEYAIGDEFIEEISLDNIGEEFGRRIITLAQQALSQRIRDVEKDNIFNEFESKVGEVIVGEIYQIRRNDLLVMYDKREMRLPREEQIPNERYKKNGSIKAIIKEVRRSGTSGLPDIILSRSDEQFLAKLFEVEIPEIYDGVIEIKAIARDPGERAKVAVLSFDERVDPVGACVGMKGIRIHSIVRELNNENIDVIEYNNDPQEFIKRALSPAKVKEISIDKDLRTANVVVPDDQVSLAIGKQGQNVRLASRLTGYTLTLIKEGAEDIELFEFRDDIGRELYDAIIESHIDTAREFLASDLRYILQIDGMTPEKLIAIRTTILEEFEEREDPNITERVYAAFAALDPDNIPTESLEDEISGMFDTMLSDSPDDGDDDETENEGASASSSGDGADELQVD
ncbi:MAG: transcription termination factor NusA [Candidatus Kapabacteria bacterium]|nr:transcription termination factor NusA [Candidatus Kapabacteria bacterium]